MKAKGRPSNTKSAAELPVVKVQRLGFATRIVSFSLLKSFLQRHRTIVGLALFLAVYFCYCSNRTYTVASDTRAVSASAGWIAQGYGLSLNTHPSFQGNFKDFGYWGTRLPDNRIVSVYPIGASVTAAPLYWIAYVLGYSKSYADDGLLTKWVASFMLAVACWCCWRTMLSIFDPITALVCTSMLAFGTPLFSTLSQSLWIQTPAIMCQAISLCLAASWLFRRVPQQLNISSTAFKVQALAAGFFAAWATACRPNFAIWAALLCVAAILILRWRCIFLLAGSAVAAICYFLLNEATYGSYLGLYVAKAEAAGFSMTLAGLFTGLGGLLISPSRGILLFSPWTILTIVGGVMVVRHKDRRNAGNLCLVIYCILTLLILAAFGIWWGGWSNGPRLQSDFMLPAAILAGSPVAWLLSRIYGILVILILAAPAVTIQHKTSRMLGYYWEEALLTSKRKDSEALWDWRLGNWNWIWTEGWIERAILKESRDPVIKDGEELSAKRPDFGRYIQNGFYQMPENLSQVRTRTSKSNLIFYHVTPPTEPIYLSGAISDQASWGTRSRVNFYINSVPVGTVEKMSATAPQNFSFLIEPTLLGRFPFDVLTVEEPWPPREGGGSSYAIISNLLLTDQQ